MKNSNIMHNDLGIASSLTVKIVPMIRNEQESEKRKRTRDKHHCSSTRRRERSMYKIYKRDDRGRQFSRKNIRSASVDVHRRRKRKAPVEIHANESHCQKGCSKAPDSQSTVEPSQLDERRIAHLSLSLCPSENFVQALKKKTQEREIFKERLLQDPYLDHRMRWRTKMDRL